MNPAECGSAAECGKPQYCTSQNANTNTPVGCWYECGSAAHIGVCRTAALSFRPFSCHSVEVQRD